MTIKFVEHTISFKKGTVVNLPSPTAKAFIKLKKAIAYNESKQEKKEVKQLKKKVQ